MITRVLSPRGLGAVALFCAAGAGAFALVGIPLVQEALQLYKQDSLGETGRTFLSGVHGFTAAFAIYASVLGALLLDVRGLATALDQRSAHWRTPATALAVLAAICFLQWGLSFLKQFLTILGPGPTFYNRAEWLGLPLLVSDEAFGLNDYFTSLLLLLAAGSAGGTYLRTSSLQPARLPREFFALCAFGFAFLALDEYLTIHEFIGANVPVLRDVSFVGHPDDLVMLAYLVGGGGVLLRYLKPLLKDRVGVAIMTAAVGLQAVAAIGDAWFPASLWQLEETCEVAAAGMYYLFVVRYGDRKADPLSLSLPVRPRLEQMQPEETPRQVNAG